MMTIKNQQETFTVLRKRNVPINAKGCYAFKSRIDESKLEKTLGANIRPGDFVVVGKDEKNNMWELERITADDSDEFIF